MQVRGLGGLKGERAGLRLESIDGFFDTLVRDAAGFSGEGLIKLGFALEVGGGWELVLACELLGVVWNTMEQ
jgi:hypothetical protein